MLLPCPFCGGADVVASLDGAQDWRVSCGRCGAEGGPRETRDEAIDAWNRRATPATSYGRALLDTLDREGEGTAASEQLPSDWLSELLSSRDAEREVEDDGEIEPWVASVDGGR